MARHSFSFDLMLVGFAGRVWEMAAPDTAAACSISGDSHWRTRSEYRLTSDNLSLSSPRCDWRH